MEELLGHSLKHQHARHDGKTFRTEAAKTLLALTQDASQVGEAASSQWPAGHAVARRSRARAKRAGRLAALANALARANAKGERPADALAVALAGENRPRRCVVAPTTLLIHSRGRTRWPSLQNARCDPRAPLPWPRAKAVTALLKRFARRGAAAAGVLGRRLRGVRPEPVGGGDVRTLLLRPPSTILSALLPLLLDGHVETPRTPPRQTTRSSGGFTALLPDVSAHGVLLDDC